MSLTVPRWEEQVWCSQFLLCYPSNLHLDPMTMVCIGYRGPYAFTCDLSASSPLQLLLYPVHTVVQDMLQGQCQSAGLHYASCWKSFQKFLSDNNVITVSPDDDIHFLSCLFHAKIELLVLWLSPWQPWLTP